jgi:hypothetical protein
MLDQLEFGRVQSMQQIYYKNRVLGHNGRPIFKNHRKLTTDHFEVIQTRDYSLKTVEWHRRKIQIGYSQVRKVLGSSNYGSVH